MIKNLSTKNYFHEDHSDKNYISVDKWIINNNISHILSVSDNESFHLSIVTTIENNCNYYITNWCDIAKNTWSIDNIYNNIDHIVNAIILYNNKSIKDKLTKLNKNKTHLLSNYVNHNENFFINNII